MLLESGTHKAKLADFGLAKANRATVTRGVGTPVYMPPELFEDDDEPEKTNMLAIDIYAIAVITWQLWFKQSPFPGKSIHSVISVVMRGKRPPMKPKDWEGPSPPDALVSLIEDCWAQSAFARPDINAVFSRFEGEVVPAVEAIIQAAAPDDAAGAAEGGAAEGGAAEASAAEAGAASLTVMGAKSLLARDGGGQKTLKGFLKSANLEKFEAKLAEQGYTDVESISDREILDDGTLARDIGMSKVEIRKFRAQIEMKGTGPTMMRKARAEVARENRDIAAAKKLSANGTASRSKQAPSGTFDGLYGLLGGDVEGTTL